MYVAGDRRLLTNMNNNAQHHRPLSRFVAGLAAVAAVMVPSLADGGAASAGGVEPVSFDLPSDVKPFDPVPIPCQGWWCDDPSILNNPDYVASFDRVVSPVPTYYKGVRAERYGVQIYNDGSGNPGAVYSTIAALGGEKILGIDTRRYTDLEFSPVSKTATLPAPILQSYLDDAWIIHDVDGFDAGWRNQRYVFVWVSGDGETPLQLRVNEHVGVDLLGTPGLDGYRQAEADRSNNRISWSNRG